MPQARAECADCGEVWTGDFEAVADAVDDHEQFHDVQIQRVATDGGLPDHLTRLSAFGGSHEMVRCTTCGREAASQDALDHRDGCPDAAADVATDGGTDLPETLYYTGGNAGASRRLHADPDCRYLEYIDNVLACTAARPPRGQLCQECADHLTLDDLVERRAVTDGGETISKEELEQRKRQRGSHPDDGMERVTFRMPEDLLATVDDAVAAGLYPNRSEALRDAIRGQFVADATTDYADVLDEALETWGKSLQIDVAIEELSEATTELARVQRGTATQADVVSELADAEIVLDQMARIFGSAQVNAAIDESLADLQDRLDAAAEGEVS